MFPNLPNLKRLTIDGSAIFSPLKNLTYLTIEGHLSRQVSFPTIYDLTNLEYLVIHNYEDFQIVKNILQVFMITLQI